MTSFLFLASLKPLRKSLLSKNLLPEEGKELAASGANFSPFFVQIAGVKHWGSLYESDKLNGEIQY